MDKQYFEPLIEGASLFLKSFTVEYYLTSEESTGEGVLTVGLYKRTPDESYDEAVYIIVIEEEGVYVKKFDLTEEIDFPSFRPASVFEAQVDFVQLCYVIFAQLFDKKFLPMLSFMADKQFGSIPEFFQDVLLLNEIEFSVQDWTFEIEGLGKVWVDYEEKTVTYKTDDLEDVSEVSSDQEIFTRLMFLLQIAADSLQRDITLCAVTDEEKQRQEEGEQVEPPTFEEGGPAEDTYGPSSPVSGEEPGAGMGTAPEVATASRKDSVGYPIFSEQQIQMQEIKGLASIFNQYSGYGIKASEMERGIHVSYPGGTIQLDMLSGQRVLLSSTLPGKRKIFMKLEEVWDEIDSLVGSVLTCVDGVKRSK